MDLLHDFGIGFGVALGVENLLALLLGASLGVAAGVLPGIGPVAMIALLLPAMAWLDATPALVMLAAVYAGAQYGAAASAILLRPARPSVDAATALDGCQMARQGRAGTALSVATFGQFVAGCFGTLVIALLALPLAGLALRFGPAEYFSLTVLGLVGAAAFASGSFAKGIGMTLLGLLLAQVGADPGSKTVRFAFDVRELDAGIGFVALALGLLGVAEVVVRLGQPGRGRDVVTRDIGPRLPTAHDLREAWPSVVRGSALGAVLGLLPGHGASLASFASYAVENSVIDRPRVPFGKGAIQGVAGPEAANQAATQTAFVPMLAFGIAPNAVMALLVGVMTLKGIHPGPQVMTAQPQLFWGLVASMWVGNVLLVALSLPFAGAWAKLLTLPYRLVFPAVVLVCALGAYGLGHRAFDVYLVALVAVVGYGFVRLGCDAAPLLLGFIMAPLLEENLRGALLASNGEWKTLITRPLSSGFLVAAALLIVVVAFPSVRQKREAALHEQ